MFPCTLEAASKIPLCAQRSTALKREMERGGIRPGERMPSKRELAARYRTMHAACTVPGFEPETLRKFIAGGFLERHIARMRVVYRARLAALTETVQALNLGSVSCSNPGTVQAACIVR